MNEQNLLLINIENGICTLTINLPQKHNILTRETFTELGSVLRSVGEDGDSRVVILRGAGEKAFSAGYDIKLLTQTEDVDNEDPLEEVILAIENCSIPVIAMIYGYCIGAGCGLASACDLRLAADNARLGITAARLGAIYPPGATLSLINLVGITAAKEMLYTGRIYDAREAKETGLVNQVLMRNNLAKVTHDLAREIADNSPLSVRGSKKIISRLSDYRSLNNKEREEFLSLQKQAAESRDLKEGSKAFSEKRKPVFRGE
jgi:enoyl-CoA hydratase